MYQTLPWLRRKWSKEILAVLHIRYLYTHTASAAPLPMQYPKRQWTDRA